MSGRLSKFQTIGFKYWKGMTKDNHLGAIFQRKPQLATNTMIELLAFRNGNTLESLVNRLPRKQFDNDEEFYWNVIGSSRRNIPLVEARDENGTPVTSDYSGNVGAGTARFELVFDEDWFALGEYIVGNLNEVYQFRILENPRKEGTRFVYPVELGGGNMDGVPAERLLPGERFSIEAAFVETELSRKVGDIRFSTPVAMRNEWSTVRIQHKVTGNELDKKMAVGLPIVKQTNGRYTHTVVDTWMYYVDFKLEEQFSEYKNNALVFGRSNRNKNGEYTNIGRSGGVIKTGAGLFEQMEVANTMHYNDFSLRLIEEALYQLSAAKLNFNERKFVLRTGERGAALFHKAVKEDVSGWLPFEIDNSSVKVIQKTSSELHQTALAAGYQFTEWRAPNGLVLSVEVDPFYDDPVRNKMKHYLGGPAMSYRFDIFDIGSMDQPNIQICEIKGKPEYRGYQAGMRNPFLGTSYNPYMSYDEDSAVIHKMAQLGIMVLDPTRTMSIIPNVLAG